MRCCQTSHLNEAFLSFKQFAFYTHDINFLWPSNHKFFLVLCINIHNRCVKCVKDIQLRYPIINLDKKHLTNQCDCEYFCKMFSIKKVNFLVQASFVDYVTTPENTWTTICKNLLFNFE